MSLLERFSVKQQLSFGFLLMAILLIAIATITSQLNKTALLSDEISGLSAATVFANTHDKKRS